MPVGSPPTEIPWIEPYPDLALEGVPDVSPGPSAQYELRETVRLAFIGATQRLPARQRAVLLLRDVLGWSTSETAKALNLTAASVTSALQRARATLDKGLSRDEISDSAGGDAAQDSLASQYASAWERQDLGGLVALLTKDATMSMPPWTLWYSGRARLRAFFEYAWRVFGQGGTFRLLPTRSNSQVAFGTYLRRPGEDRYHADIFQVLTFRKGRIGRITLFVNPNFFPSFHLPSELTASP
jgi:RNA polymerase sigma-70 factor (ECF subfamily)